MNYHFELRKDKINKDGLIPIRLVVTHGKSRIRKNINAKTIDTDWNKDNFSDFRLIRSLITRSFQL